jgi:hypothetical protein
VKLCSVGRAEGATAVTKVHPASRADFASHPRSTSDNSAAPPSGTPRPRRLLPTIHRNVKCGADLTHAPIAETSNPLHQGRNRNTFDRIKVDSATATDLIVPWLEHHLAGEIANRRCARCHQGSSQPRNGRIARKHHHGSSLYFWQLAPPEFAPQRYRSQEAAAPARNAARFPHSSIASIGNSSYAA